MKSSPRHTKIAEIVATEFGTLIREDYYQYPRTESNLYMTDSENNVLWFAERAMGDDAYAGQIRQIDNQTIKCASWNGFDCEIDLQTGKLVNAQFTK